MKIKVDGEVREIPLIECQRWESDFMNTRQAKQSVSKCFAKAAKRHLMKSFDTPINGMVDKRPDTSYSMQGYILSCEEMQAIEDRMEGLARLLDEAGLAINNSQIKKVDMKIINLLIDHIQLK